MNSKLKYGTAFGVCLTVLLLSIFSFSLMNKPESTVILVTEQSKPTGHVKAEVWRNGVLIYSFETHNILVTTGSTWVKDFLRQGTTGATNATDDIAIGTHGTPQASDQKLANELTTNGLDRRDASSGVTNLNSTAYKVEYTWTATGSVSTINATSLHHDPTDNTSGNAVAIATIAIISNIIANDQVKITWTLNVPSGS